MYLLENDIQTSKENSDIFRFLHNGKITPIDVSLNYGYGELGVYKV